MGGPTNTRINGRLETSAAIGFAGSGYKYFRNGIKMLMPSISVEGLLSGKFIIDGANAILYGLNCTIVTPIDGMDIGNGGGTLVSMATPLFIVDGNINLIGGNSRVLVNQWWQKIMRGTNTIPFSFRRWSSGFYYLAVTGEEGTGLCKFLRQ
jgi:hypothetical protein